MLPGIAAILPPVADIWPYLPVNAGVSRHAHLDPGSPSLPPWAGFALFCGYAAVAVVAAAIRLLRRDA